MKYGHLTVICGPMYSGKTTELLKRVLWAKNGENRPVLVVKPEMDDRYAEVEIVSHDGLSVAAYPISGWLEVEELAEHAELVFFDEVQFFTPPDFMAEGGITGVVRALLKAGKNVVANGLDMDVRGEPFESTASLIAMADDVIKLKAACSICGRPATKTFKTSPSSTRVELGSTGLYEPRCNEHWS